MAIDRAALLRQAEKLLRLGKLQQAIAEYERVVDDHPGDLTTANNLGDLYVRAGQQERAVQVFARIAADLEREGFFAKAGAIYKKILKIDPADEPTLLKAAEIEAAQGLLADARAHFHVVSRQRRSRGDERGVAQIVVRLASLDPLDVPARVAGAKARVSLGEHDAAIADLQAFVAELTELERHADAGSVLREIVALDPTDREARRQIARASLAAGDVDAVLQFVSGDDQSVEPALWSSLAESLLQGGRVQEGLALIDRWLAQGEAAWTDVARLGAALAAVQPDAGYQIVLRAATSAAERNDWPSAAAFVTEFLARVPGNVPALTRLVEIAVDGDLDAVLTDAQGRLADVYLEAGRAAEARFIAEDLASRQPDDLQNLERLKRALRMLGEPDPESAVAREPEEAAPQERPASVAADRVDAARVASPSPHAIDIAVASGDRLSPVEMRQQSRSAEVDLSIALDGIVTPVASAPTPAAAASSPDDLEGVFAKLREEAGRKPLLETAEHDLHRGQALFQCGQFEECLAPLQSAARVPRLRFESASLLGRAYRTLHRTAEAMAWTERAAEAPATTPEAGYLVLYELADALEQAGDATRALAICLELQSETTIYPDLPARIGRLSTAAARG